MDHGLFLARGGCTHVQKFTNPIIRDGQEKAKDAIPALTLALKDADEDVRSVAKKSLASIKESVGEKEADKLSEKLVPIVKDLQSKDNKVRLEAIAQLEEIGVDAKSAGAALVEFGMMNANPKVRDAATRAFEKIDPVVHKEVLTILVDESLQNRNRSVETLKTLGARAKASIPAIKLYHNSLSQGLVQGFNGPPVIRTRPGARIPTPLHTLRAMAVIAPDDTSIQTVILGVVGGREDGVPRLEMIALMSTLRVENKQKYAALMSGLVSTRDDRAMIIGELAKLGSDAKAALPILQQLKTDKEAAVRAAAAAAVEAIKE